MSLSDPLFLAFLLPVFMAFYALRAGAPRRLFLLAASLLFYVMMSRFYVGVLLFAIVVTYGGALLIDSARGTRRGLTVFFGVILLLLIPLLLLRYGPAMPPLSGLSPLSSALAALSLPVGISFFTFTAMGYVIDVYLEVIEAERDPVRVALFLSFFPLVTAGPIERAGRLLPQFDLDRPFTAERGFAALRLILLGLFFKVVFAGLLMKPVDNIFVCPSRFSVLEQFLGTLYYAFYIYGDFAGYSLIAIGSAKLLGIEVRPNFLQPFLSTTIPEYWRCWHISLSSWVRDYLFAPLRTTWRKWPALGTSAALLITFIVIGVWHGPKWNYLWYGVMYGVYSIVSFFTLPKRNALYAALRIPSPVIRVWRTLCTFTLVLLVFVMWRAETVHDALGIYRALFSWELPREIGSAIAWGLFHVGHSPAFQAIGDPRCVGAIAGLIGCDILARRGFAVEKLPVWIQFVLYNLAFLVLLSSWLIGYGKQPFIYYKF